jgi:hypothetical protein
MVVPPILCCDKRCHRLLEIARIAAARSRELLEQWRRVDSPHLNVLRVSAGTVRRMVGATTVEA